MAYKVMWGTPTGAHVVTYANAGSVGGHVEHCLHKGWPIIMIQEVEDSPHDKPTVIFTRRYSDKRRTTITHDILGVLYEHEDMNPLEIAEAIGVVRKSDHGKAESVRSMLYSMAKNGLVEKVEGTRPVRWRVKR